MLLSITSSFLRILPFLHVLFLHGVFLFRHIFDRLGVSVSNMECLDTAGFILNRIVACLLIGNSIFRSGFHNNYGHLRYNTERFLYVYLNVVFIPLVMTGISPVLEGFVFHDHYTLKFTF